MVEGKLALPPSSLQPQSCRFRKRFLVAVELLARLDVGVLGDALFIRTDGAEHDPEHPAHVELGVKEVVPLAGVAAEVEHHRELGLQDRLSDALAVAKDRLELAPLR
jgi:hypothetical protein